MLYISNVTGVQITLATSLDHHKNTAVEQFKEIKLATCFIFFFSCQTMLKTGLDLSVSNC